MALDSLFTVQDHDTTLEQLRHQRESLPERGRVDECDTRRAELESAVADIDGERDGLLREQRRLEDEVALLEAKRDEEQAKLYEGGVTSPKEAQALQDEIDSLQRHQDSLEDRIIGLMEQIEPLTAARDGHDGQLAEIADERARLEQAIAEAEAEIDARLADVEAQRVAAVDQVDDPDAVARYETVRAGLGAAAVVHFDGKNCSGCPLSMPAVEADRVKKQPPGSLVDCNECGRLVLR